MRESGRFNWLIGVGYCLVAIVILMNYLYPKPSKAQPGTAEVQEPSQSEAELLRLQLEEERKIKHEMSEMISRLQTNLVTVHEEKAGAVVEEQVPGTPMTAQDVRDYLKKDFSHLRHQFSKNSGRDFAGNSGRNPFVPFYEVSRREESKPQAVEGPTITLQTSPVIPLPFLGTLNMPQAHDSLE